MPEPLLYLQSLGAAALAGAVCVLARAGRRAMGPMRLNAACILAGCLGMAAGCWLLRWQLAWPPASALDRVITFLIPAALSIELLAGSPRIGPAFAWALRVIFVAAAPLVLLHGSIYLTGSGGEWTTWQAVLLLMTCSALLAALWAPLTWLSQRSCSGLSIAGSLALATLSAGGAVMLGGYLKGGAIAFAFAGALAGVTLAARLITPRLAPAVVALGVVQLFGVVGVGHFFGRLPAGSALGLLLAPLLCCASEIPVLRQRPPWVIGTLRLLLVAIPLLMILTVAKLNFDRKMAPLLSHVRCHPKSTTVIDCSDITVVRCGAGFQRPHPQIQLICAFRVGTRSARAGWKTCPTRGRDSLERSSYLRISARVTQAGRLRYGGKGQF